MSQETAFDLSRKGYESWPFMFGSMYYRVFETAALGGIEAATPQVHMLVTWCQPFFNPQQREALAELRKEELDWIDLHEMLDACLEVAQAKGAWEFKRDTFEESNFAPE